MAKKITLGSIAASIDELARATARGFERVEKQLDIIEDDVADLKKDMHNVKSRLKIADEIEGSDVSVWDDHEKRIRTLESKAGIMPLDYPTLDR